MRYLLVTAIIIFIASNVFGELPETKTINQQTLTEIRNACKEPSQGGDDLINHYYMEYKGNSKDEEEYGEEMYDEQGRGQAFGTTTYMKKAFLGVIDVDLLGIADDYLDDAYRFLFDSGFPAYLSIENDVIPYLTMGPDTNGNPSKGRKCLDMGYILQYLATTVDMLWWYEGHGFNTQQEYQDSLASKLDSLASWVYIRLQNTKPWGYEDNGPNGEIYPAILAHNYRLRTLGALGYTGCVLNSIDYIETVEYDLFESNLVYNNSFSEMVTYFYHGLSNDTDTKEFVKKMLLIK